MTIEEMVANAHASLTETMQSPHLFPDTRARELAHWREALALLMAETASGVSRHLAANLRVYSWSQFSPAEIAQGRAFSAALMDAYAQLPETIPGFLAMCERLMAEPLATAAD